MKIYTIIILVLVGICWLMPKQCVNALNLVDYALKKANLSFHDKILKLIPQEKKEIYLKTIDHVNACFDSKVGKNHIHLFNGTVRSAIKQYFKTHKNWILTESPKRIIRRILRFIKSTLNLAIQVIDCMLDVDKGQKPTVYGFTELSALSPSEFRKKILNKNVLNPFPSFHFSRNNEKLRYTVNNKTITNPMANKFKDFPSVDLTNKKNCGTEHLKEKGENIPFAFNWKNLNVLSDVRNQGSCPSCWLFNTIDMIETHYRIQNNIAYNRNNNTRLTEQDALDCTLQGCSDGSFPIWALYWAHHIGLASQKDNPYQKASHPNECVAHKPIIKISSFCANILLKLEDHRDLLKTYLLNHGPLVVAIETNNLQNLRGPFNGRMNAQPDHAILLVGWDRQYWIFKNSWGVHWGIDGYLYLNMNSNSGIEQNINFSLGVKRIN